VGVGGHLTFGAVQAQKTVLFVTEKIYHLAAPQHDHLSNRTARSAEADQGLRLLQHRDLGLLATGTFQQTAASGRLGVRREDASGKQALRKQEKAFR